MGTFSAESAWPLLDGVVWVQAAHHPAQLLGDITVPWLLIADLGEPLRFSAGVVPAPLAEYNIANLHLVVGSMDLEDLGLAEAGRYADFGRAQLMDHFEVAVGPTAAANLGLADCVAAAVLPVLDPLTLDEPFKLTHAGGYLLVFLLAS